jgi:hypothetical protein
MNDCSYDAPSMNSIKKQNRRLATARVTTLTADGRRQSPDPLVPSVCPLRLT